MKCATCTLISHLLPTDQAVRLRTGRDTGSDADHR